MIRSRRWIRGLVIGSLLGLGLAVHAMGTLAVSSQPALLAGWSLVPRGPAGGRLTITVTNDGSSTLTNVAIDGLLPEPLTFAGPRAVPTSLRCKNDLSADDTICTGTWPSSNPEGVVGQTIRIDEEQILVAARTPAGSDDLKLVRGANGTTAAAHKSNATVYFMRPDIQWTDGATGAYCVVGLPRRVGCGVDTLPPGGTATALVDVGVASAGGSSAPAGLEFKVWSKETSPQTITATAQMLGGYSRPAAGGSRLTIPGLANDGTGGGTTERLRVKFSASFPSSCEITTATPVTWELGGWTAATRSLIDDYIVHAPIVAKLDGQNVLPQVSISTTTYKSPSGSVVPAVRALWSFEGPALPPGEHIFSVSWGPATADIDDGLGSPLTTDSVVGPYTQRVVATPAASYPGTNLPPCAIFPR